MTWWLKRKQSNVAAVSLWNFKNLFWSLIKKTSLIYLLKLKVIALFESTPNTTLLIIFVLTTLIPKKWWCEVREFNRYIYKYLGC